MQNFRQHDLPYFRIPRICNNPEFEKIASLGLKVQWVDPTTGERKEAIAQRMTMFKNKKPYGLKTSIHIPSTLT